MTTQEPTPTTKRRIKKIAPLQAGLMLGIIYGLLSILLVPLFVLIGLSGSLAAKETSGGAAVPFVLAMSIGMAMLAPVLYGVLGFIGGVLGSLIYNLVAKWIGGIEVEVA